MTDWAIVLIILLALFTVGFFVLLEIDRLLAYWQRWRWTR
jgi:uncharacterized membrane protein YsdA (DUF1294 family)